MKTLTLALILTLTSGCLSSAQIERNYSLCLRAHEDEIDCKFERDTEHSRRQTNYWVVPLWVAVGVSTVVFGLAQHIEAQKQESQ